MRERYTIRRSLLAHFGAGLAVALGLSFAAVPAAADIPDDQMARVPPTSMSGSTGLIRIPTGEVLPYMQYVLGINQVDRKYRPYFADNERGDSVAHFFTAGVLPRVEVTARITNHDGKLGVQFREDISEGRGGWNFDRMFSIQALLARQTERWPVSLAAGYQDLTGTGVFRSRYLVATHRWPRLGVHLGVGDLRLGPVFGGIDYQPLPSLRLMLDHDGSDANVGLTWQYRHFRITPILTGMEALGGGITYTNAL